MRDVILSGAWVGGMVFAFLQMAYDLAFGSDVTSMVLTGVSAVFFLVAFVIHVQDIWRLRAK